MNNTNIFSKFKANKTNKYSNNKSIDTCDINSKLLDIHNSILNTNNESDNSQIKNYNNMIGGKQETDSLSTLSLINNEIDTSKESILSPKFPINYSTEYYSPKSGKKSEYSQLKSESELQTGSESDTETTETGSDTETTETGSETDAETEVETETDAETGSETDAETEVETETDAETEVETEVETELETEINSESHIKKNTQKKAANKKSKRGGSLIKKQKDKLNRLYIY